MQSEINRLKQQLKAGVSEIREEGGRTQPMLTNWESDWLKEQLEAAQAIAEEQSRSWEEAKKQAEAAKTARTKMLMKLGVQKMKYQEWLNKMQQKVEKNLKVGVLGMAMDALPFISNESQDPYLSGRLQYSFAQHNLFYIGSDYDELKEFAEHELRNEFHLKGWSPDDVDVKVGEISRNLQ